MKKNLLSKYKSKKAFTLVEILVAILIVSSVIIVGFELYTKAIASKVKIDEQANLEKNIYYFSEKIFQLVKNGGTIDYEEYFNRRMLSTGTYKSGKSFTLKDKISNGYFSEKTGFGNFGFYGKVGTKNYGKGFYYCRSGENIIVYAGCFINNKVNIDSKMTNPAGTGRNYNKNPQRYGQYSFQFIDYNSNADNDGGDEDGDGNIMRDDDDKHLGNGPIAFPSGADLKELYLLSGDKKTRTFIRWNIEQDDFASERNSSFNCNSSLKKESNGTYLPEYPDKFKYCRGTIEFLQLEGKDWGMNHDSAIIDADGTQNDGVIDTWLIASNFSGKSNIDTANSIVAGTNHEDYWKPLFSDSINISDFRVYAYPNIDSSKVWDIPEEEQKQYLISPYVVLSFEIRPSWRVKSKISGGEIKPVRFNTTINLTEIFSN